MNSGSSRARGSAFGFKRTPWVFFQEFCLIFSFYGFMWRGDHTLRKHIPCSVAEGCCFSHEQCLEKTLPCRKCCRGCLRVQIIYGSFESGKAIKRGRRGCRCVKLRVYAQGASPVRSSKASLGACSSTGLEMKM